jgi:hypothetical protein
MGAKVKSKMKEFANALDVNEVIKSLALSYSEADKKLEELATICNTVGYKNE